MSNEDFVKINIENIENYWEKVILKQMNNKMQKLSYLHKSNSSRKEQQIIDRERKLEFLKRNELRQEKQAKLVGRYLDIKLNQCTVANWIKVFQIRRILK